MRIDHQATPEKHLASLAQNGSLAAHPDQSTELGATCENMNQQDGSRPPISAGWTAGSADNTGTTAYDGG